MSWTGVVVGGASLLGSLLSSSADSSATQAQINAADAQIKLAQSEFNTEQKNLAPYQSAGLGAFQQLTAGLQPGGQFNKPFNAADYQQSPGYAFEVQQGNQAVTAGAAARRNVPFSCDTSSIARH